MFGEAEDLRVKKAHLNGIVPEEVFSYVRLPDGRCWRLRRWLYGMRPAASAWEANFTKRLESVGFKRGASTPTVFYNSEKDGRRVLHGDDFTFLLYEDDVDKVVKQMKTWYDIKVRGVLGDRGADDHEVTILNRKLTWTEGCIEYEADDKHARIITEEFGLTSESKGLEAPVERESPEDVQARDGEENDVMEPAAATKFRALAVRANFLAMDRSGNPVRVKRSLSQYVEADVQERKEVEETGEVLTGVPEADMEVRQERQE
jgi:hypothetical protein